MVKALRAVGAVAGVLLLAVIAGALLWNASEQHYANCLRAHLIVGTGSQTLQDAGRLFNFGQDNPPVQDVLTHASIKGCSRFP